MTYNGFANYQTWNVVLWINHHEDFYNIARACASYDEFVNFMRSLDGPAAIETPDNVSWADPTIDRESINRDWVQDFVEVEA